MLTKNIILKGKQTYIHKDKKKDEITLTIQVNSNHQLDKETIEKIEKQIKDITLYSYTIQNDNNKPVKR